jgi:hypothetical protein
MDTLVRSARPTSLLVGSNFLIDQFPALGLTVPAAGAIYSDGCFNEGTHSSLLCLDTFALNKRK